MTRGTPQAESSAESDLVARLTRGDEAAYETLVRTHGPRMLAVARRLLPVEADAQDALQDAFVSVVRSIGDFDGRSRLGTWLHRVVVNAALMRLRTRRRRPEVPADEAMLEAGFASASRASRGAALDVLSRAETRRIVRDGLERLPDGHRTVVLLRDVEGLDLSEVARLLGIGLTTAKARLHRARLALRALLEFSLPETPA